MSQVEVQTTNQKKSACSFVLYPILKTVAPPVIATVSWVGYAA